MVRGRPGTLTQAWRCAPPHPPTPPPRSANLVTLLSPSVCSCGSQGDFDSPVLRLHYTSLRSPDQTIDYNMDSRAR